MSAQPAPGPGLSPPSSLGSPDPVPREEAAGSRTRRLGAEPLPGAVPSVHRGRAPGAASAATAPLLWQREAASSQSPPPFP